MKKMLPITIVTVCMVYLDFACECECPVRGPRRPRRECPPLSASDERPRSNVCGLQGETPNMLSKLTTATTSNTGLRDSTGLSCRYFYIYAVSGVTYQEERYNKRYMYIAYDNVRRNLHVTRGPKGHISCT